MSLPLVFRPEVRDEVNDAYGWYERQRAGLGSEFLIAVQSALDGVQEAPGRRAAIHKDIRAALVRRFPYVIYFASRPSGSSSSRSSMAIPINRRGNLAASRVPLTNSESRSR